MSHSHTNNVKWVLAERKQTKNQAQKRDRKFESSYQWKAMLAKGLDPSAIAPSIKRMTYIPFMLCFKRCFEVTLKPESIRLLHLEHVFRKNIKPLSWLYHTDCCDLLSLVMGDSYTRVNIWKLSQEVVTLKKEDHGKLFLSSCYLQFTNSYLFHEKVIGINRKKLMCELMFLEPTSLKF